MIEIDGSLHEGGGQMLRTALALSILSQRPFKMTNIRVGRDNPGLKKQHQSAIEILLMLSESSCSEYGIGSTEIEFIPGKFKSQNFEFSVGTAGSLTLLLQSLMIPFMFGSKTCTIKLKGGTDVSWSPPIDYFQNVLLPHIQKYSKINFSLIKRGFYPKGGGEIELKIKPLFKKNKLPFEEFIRVLRDLNLPLNLDGFSHLMKINGINFASTELAEKNVLERIEKIFRLYFKRNISCRFQNIYTKTKSTGVGSVFWLTKSKNLEDIDFLNPVVLGTNVLGEKRISSEVLGETIAKQVESLCDADYLVDEHLCDQLVPFVALFGGSIKTKEITNHTLSNIYVCEKFLDVSFEVNIIDNIIRVN